MTGIRKKDIYLTYVRNRARMMYDFVHFFAVMHPEKAAVGRFGRFLPERMKTDMRRKG